MRNLYWLTDAQMERLKPFFPKSHGKSRVDDCRVMSGIIFINRNGLRWFDAPKKYGPAKTLYNRWKCWSDSGVFARIMMGLAAESAEHKTIMTDVEPGQRHRFERTGEGISRHTARRRACGAKKGGAGGRSGEPKVA